MGEVEDARDLFRRRLGTDWEVRLMQADALPRIRATTKATEAAERRAVNLVEDACEFWSPQIGEAVVNAWRVLTIRAR